MGKVEQPGGCFSPMGLLCSFSVVLCRVSREGFQYSQVSQFSSVASVVGPGLSADCTRCRTSVSIWRDFSWLWASLYLSLLWKGAAAENNCVQCLMAFSFFFFFFFGFSALGRVTASSS